MSYAGYREAGGKCDQDCADTCAAFHEFHKALHFSVKGVQPAAHLDLQR